MVADSAEVEKRLVPGKGVEFLGAADTVAEKCLPVGIAPDQALGERTWNSQYGIGMAGDAGDRVLNTKEVKTGPFG